MNTDNYYQVRQHRDTYNPKNYKIDNDFYYKVVDRKNTDDIENWDDIDDIKFICDSIERELPDWEDKPTLEVVRKRLSTISGVFLFFHKNWETPIGWGWFSDVFTYDWINKVHDLPNDDAYYMGGTYITKSQKLPPTSGFQLYLQLLSYLFTRWEWGFGYMDGWNVAPIKIVQKLQENPDEQYEFIKVYNREY